MKFELEDEAQRQLLVRALAEQAIHSPGFADASRRIAVRFEAGEMFDSFVEVMKDRADFRQRLVEDMIRS